MGGLVERDDGPTVLKLFFDSGEPECFDPSTLLLGLALPTSVLVNSDAGGLHPSGGIRDCNAGIKGGGGGTTKLGIGPL